jgi:hypothetical protein
MAEGLERIRTQDKEEDNEIRERILRAGKLRYCSGNRSNLRLMWRRSSDQGIACKVGSEGEFGEVEENIRMGRRLRPWIIC